MKSRAHIESHPIHPMLVSLPIGLWTGSLAYDLASAASGDAPARERLRRSSNIACVYPLANSSAPCRGPACGFPFHIETGPRLDRARDFAHVGGIRAVAELRQPGILHRHCRAAGEQEGSTTCNAEHAERANEGRDLEPRDLDALRETLRRLPVLRDRIATGAEAALADGFSGIFEALEPPADPPSVDLSPYVGRYARQSVEMTLTSAGDHLVAQMKTTGELAKTLGGELTRPDVP